jgi:hypothetical protein
MANFDEGELGSIVADSLANVLTWPTDGRAICSTSLMSTSSS